MKKLGLFFVLLLSLAAIGVFYFGAAMMAQEEADAFLLYTRYDEELETSSLYVLNVTTGEEQQLSTLTNSADAGWAPDGRIWLVDSPIEDERRLRFFDAETGEETVFGESLFLDYCFPSLTWSPTGEQLAYVTGEQNELVLKFVNLADGGSYQTTINQNEVPYWSSDANYVLIGNPYGDTHGRLLSAENGNEILTVENSLGFSPDSRYLAYGDENDLAFLYELATGETIELGDKWDYGAWSPSGRYLIMSNYTPSLQLAHYDVQSGRLATIDLGYPIDFVAWDNDDTALLYSNFSEYTERPTRLTSYNLADGNSTSILEDTAWIAQIYQSGDWLALAYSSLPSEDHYAPTDQMLFFNGRERITAELTVEIAWLSSNIAALANDRGFLIRSATALYHFDNRNAELEFIDEDHTTMPFWTADGSYLAFLSMNEAGALANLSLWDATTETASIVQQSNGYHIQILGWQGSPLRESLLYCGEG